MIGLCVTGKYQGYGDWNQANKLELTIRNDLLSIIKFEIATGNIAYINIKDKCLHFTNRYLKIHNLNLPRLTQQ